MEASNGGQSVTLDLSLEEARALKERLLKAAADGSSALDDEVLQPTLLKLEHTLEYMDGVARVREELAAGRHRGRPPGRPAGGRARPPHRRSPPRLDPG